MSAADPRNAYMAALLSSLVYSDSAQTFCGYAVKWGAPSSCT